jgi:hypothetical protein
MGGREREREREERERQRHFLFFTQEKGSKDLKNGAPYLLILYWRAGGIYVVKGYGSGWLRWLLKQSHPHPPKSQR